MWRAPSTAIHHAREISSLPRGADLVCIRDACPRHTARSACCRRARWFLLAFHSRRRSTTAHGSAAHGSASLPRGARALARVRHTRVDDYVEVEIIVGSAGDRTPLIRSPLLRSVRWPVCRFVLFFLVHLGRWLRNPSFIQSAIIFDDIPRAKHYKCATMHDMRSHVQQERHLQDLSVRSFSLIFEIEISDFDFESWVVM